MKILIILMTTLWLSGCGAISKAEYENYVAHAKAQGKTPMEKYEYFQWAAPRCQDRDCDRSELVDKKHERHEGKDDDYSGFWW